MCQTWLCNGPKYSASGLLPEGGVKLMQQNWKFFNLFPNKPFNVMSLYFTSLVNVSFTSVKMKSRGKYSSF